jgi:hypothetical protein
VPKQDNDFGGLGLNRATGKIMNEIGLGQSNANFHLTISLTVDDYHLTY